MVPYLSRRDEMEAVDRKNGGRYSEYMPHLKEVAQLRYTSLT